MHEHHLNYRFMCVVIRVDHVALPVADDIVPVERSPHSSAGDNLVVAIRPLDALDAGSAIDRFKNSAHLGVRKGAIVVLLHPRRRKDWSKEVNRDSWVRCKNGLVHELHTCASHGIKGTCVYPVVRHTCDTYCTSQGREGR